MKNVILAALLTTIAAASFAAPAAAQAPMSLIEQAQYGGGYYGDRGPRRYRERPVYREDNYDRRPRRYYEERPRYNPPPRRPVQSARVCATSRGNCFVSSPFPVGASCRCNVPGFGVKSGNLVR